MPRIAVLAVFLDEGPTVELSTREVADTLQASYASVYAVLSSLAAHNWLARVEMSHSHQPSDARVLFRLTGIGETRANQFRRFLAVEPYEVFTGDLVFSYDDDKAAPQRSRSGGRGGGQRSAKAIRARAS